MALRAVAVSLILGSAPLAAAQDPELRVAHEPRPCLLAGQAARIEARIEPASDAVWARVRFREEGEAHFYSVPMRRTGDLWVGVLPRPAADTSRIAYYIDVGAGGSRGRVPPSSAFVVDVVDTPCPEGALPVSAEGPSEVGVPRGAPRIPPGFERGNVQVFVEDAGDGSPAATPSRTAAVAPLAVLPIPLGSRVRTVAAPGDRRQEGRLVSGDGEALVLDAGEGRVRIPRGDLVSLEVREKGSGGMRVLGGLAGGVAGLAVTLLICVSAEDACDSVAVAWVGFGVGAAAGAALTGGGSWKPVTLASAGPVALDLRVRRAAAGVELRVGF